MDLEKLTDEQLATLSKDNSEALSVLLERYKRTIISFSRRYFLRDGGIDDLIQEGMIGFMKAVTSFNNTSKFKPFAITCIKTNILSAIKKSNSLKNKPLINYVPISVSSNDDDEDKTNIIKDSSIDPEEMYINDETINELLKELSTKLSSFEYKILELFYSGYSYAEICSITNKNYKSIDNALQRIKKKVANVKNEKGE